MIGGEPGARARWLGVVLILLALAVVTWQAFLAGQAEEPAAARPPASKPSLSDLLASVDSAKLGMQAASAAAAQAASAPLPPGEVELCGVGRVKADETGNPRNMEAVAFAAQAARERVLPLLRGSPDEQPRAAAWLLQAVQESAAGDGSVPTRYAARESLAQMALVTRSPQVYAWAMRACQGQRGDGMCQLLKAEQWARLDPDNAVAWLWTAVDAQARNDAAAVADAMFRVSHASRSDTYLSAFTGVVMARLPAEVSALARGAFAQELVGVETAQATPHLAASLYCAEAEVAGDANRRQTCSAMAEVFLNKGTSLTDLGLAASIGERVGWPAERTGALRDERDAVLQLRSPRPAAAPGGEWSCAALSQATRRLLEASQIGDMAVMRRVLKESPEGAAALAQRYRAAAAKPAASAALSTAER